MDDIGRLNVSPRTLVQLVAWYVQQCFSDKAIYPLFYWEKERPRFHCNLSSVWCDTINGCTLILMIILWQSRLQN